MKIGKFLVVLLSAFLLFAGDSSAEEEASLSPKHASREQMKSVYACAAKKGLRLPNPPRERAAAETPEKRGPRRLAGADTKGQHEDAADKPGTAHKRKPWFDRKKDGRADAAEGDDAVKEEKQAATPKGRRPHLTERQRAILDSCFRENGLTPPAHPGRGASSQKTGGE